MKTITQLFESLDSDRQGVLETVRELARLTNPALLPPKNHDKNQPLPGNYQSDGSRGVSGLSGKLLLGMFSPGAPWVRRDLSAEIYGARDVSDEARGEMLDSLFIEDLVITSLVETSNGEGGNDQVTGFYANMANVIEQAVATGDVLCRLDDDYQISVFRRDQYVTKRDSAKRVLMHIVKECMDPFTLDSREQERLWSQCDKQDEVKERFAFERQSDVYTLVEWHPWSKKWVQTREVTVAGKPYKVGEYEDTFSPYIAAYWKLVAGEDYGRGLGHDNYGDLKALDYLSMYILDFGDIASKHHFIYDENSGFNPANLMSPSGAVYAGRVRDGVATDVALFKADKLNDFQVVRAAREDVRLALGKAMLSDTGAVRQSERTTAFEVSKTTIQELQNATSGVYASLSDQLQMPLFRRAQFQASRDGLVDTHPNTKGVKTVVLSGLSALAMQVRFQNLMNFTDMVAKFGDQALARLNIDVILDAAARFLGVKEPGVVKSREQVEAEVNAAMQRAVQAKAAETAIDTAGAIAQQKATQ